MSELSRAEFIEANFGHVHGLDIRATIGALTIPVGTIKNPTFRAKDVLDEWKDVSLAGGTRTNNYYYVGEEIKRMAKLSMVDMVDRVPPKKAGGGGTFYRRTESDPVAAASWDLVREGALLVVELFPDAPENEIWKEFVRPQG